MLFRSPLYRSSSSVWSALGRFSLRETEIIVMAVFQIMAVIIWTVVQCGTPSSVVDGYFPYADAMFHGVLPYTEKVYVYGYYNVWEYPPLAYVLFFIPRLAGHYTAVYQAVYMGIVLVLLFIGMRYVEKIAGRAGFDDRKAVWIYALIVMMMIEFVFDRYDVVLMTICLAAIWYFLEGKFTLVAALIAIGFLFKIYLIILLPILIFYVWKKEGFTALAKPAAVFLAFCAILLPFLATGDLSQMVDYHSDRPLEFESTLGSICLLIGAVDPSSGIDFIFSYGSDNVVGGIADVLVKCVTYFMIAGVLLSWFLYCYVIRREERTDSEGNAVTAMMLMLSVQMITSYLFSAQYMIWLIPMVMAVLLLTVDRPYTVRMIGLFIVLEALTQLNFLFNVGMEPGYPGLLGILILLARNILMVVFAWMCCANLVSRIRCSPRPACRPGEEDF